MLEAGTDAAGALPPLPPRHAPRVEAEPAAAAAVVEAGLVVVEVGAGEAAGAPHQSSSATFTAAPPSFPEAPGTPAAPPAALPFSPESEASPACPIPRMCDCAEEDEAAVTTPPLVVEEEAAAKMAGAPAGDDAAV